MTLISGGVMNERRMLRRLIRLRRKYNVIGHKDCRLKEILIILKKPLEDKKTEKDLKKLEPLLSELKFFTQTRPMNYDERIEVCKCLTYVFKEPGDTVYK